MATPNKVRQFVEVSGMDAIYALTTKNMLEHIQLDQRLAGNIEGATIASAIARFATRIHTELRDVMIKFLGEECTDEEMDALITFHTSPVAKKMLALAPDMQAVMLTFFADNAERLQDIMAEIMDDELPA